MGSEGFSSRCGVKPDRVTPSPIRLRSVLNILSQSWPEGYGRLNALVYSNDHEYHWRLNVRRTLSISSLSGFRKSMIGH